MVSLLRIYFTNARQLYPVHEWQIRRQFNNIVYTRSNRFQMFLFKDERLVWKSDNVKDLYTLDIKNKGEKDLCNLSGFSDTRHCFHDQTHRTCCLLGHEARRYSDRSGNPIGSASERAFYKKHGFYPDKNTLTPWCTCIGSGVCTYYQSRFRDGTHIKYIDVNGQQVLDRKEDRYRTIVHRTPGVN